MASVLLHGGDLLSVVPTKRIQPLTFALTEGKTILIGALARVDLVHGNTALCTCYFSHKVTLHICRLAHLKPPFVRHRVSLMFHETVFRHLSRGGLLLLSDASLDLNLQAHIRMNPCLTRAHFSYEHLRHYCSI